MSSHETWLATSRHGRRDAACRCCCRRCRAHAASCSTSGRHAACASRAASRTERERRRSARAVDQHVRERAHERAQQHADASRRSLRRRLRRRHRPGDDACSARGPAARGRRTACACPGSRSAARSHRPAFAGVEEAQVGDAAFGKPAGARRRAIPARRRARAPARLVTVASVARQRQPARLAPLRAPAPSSSSRPVAPGSASANGRFLTSSSTGVWSLTSASIGAVGERRADRVAVALLAQRRRRAASRRRSSRCRRRSGAAWWMLDVAGHRQPLGLGRAHQLDAGGAADAAQVDARAGVAHQLEDRVQRDRLGDHRHARQARGASPARRLAATPLAEVARPAGAARPCSRRSPRTAARACSTSVSTIGTSACEKPTQPASVSSAISVSASPFEPARQRAERIDVRLVQRLRRGT